MNMDIERFILDHRKEFDSGDLPQGSRGRFAEKLAAAERATADAGIFIDEEKRPPEREATAWSGSRAIDDGTRKLPAKAGRRGDGSSTGGRLVHWTAIVSGIAAAVVAAVLLSWSGPSESIGEADHIERLCSLQQEIAELGETCPGAVAKEAMKTSKKLIEETVSLADQLPEELSTRKRNRILKDYYGKKAEALRRLRNCLADLCLEEGEPKT